MKKAKLFLPLIVFGALSSCVVYSLTTNQNTNQKAITKSDSNLNDQTEAQINNPYNHTNYISLPTTMPSNFTKYSLYGQTNNTMFVQDANGMVGIANDNTSIFLTSYSGKIIWAQNFANNELIKTFYARNDLTFSSLTVTSWTYLSSNQVLGVLLTDNNNNQIFVFLSMSSGMFAPDNVDNYLILNGDEVFNLFTNSSYTNSYQIGTNSILLTDNNDPSNLKLIYYNSSSKTVSAFDTTLSGIDNNVTIASFVFGYSNKSLVYTIANSYYDVANSEYYYHQYLTPLSVDETTGSLTLDTSKVVTLNNDYILTSDTLSLSDFQNRAFSNINNNIATISILCGASNYNYLNVYEYDLSSDNLTYVNELDLGGNVFSSVTYNVYTNRIFLSSSSSDDNVYLSYINLTNLSSLKKTTIQQSTDSSSKKYFLAPILEYTSSEYLLLQNNALNTNIYMVANGKTYNNTTNKMNSKYWYWVTSNSKTVWTAFNDTYLASYLTYNNGVKSYFSITYLGSVTTSQYTKSYNDVYGVLNLKIKVSYTSSYYSSYTSTFYVTVYINNFYSSNNFVFNWLDANSTIDTNKANMIATLKATKYANEITTENIIDYFIDYSIKTSSLTDFVIDTSMVTLSYDSYTYSSLTVTLNLTSSSLPTGLSSGQLKPSYTYTGFLSVNDYLVSKKSDSVINSVTNSIYPSQLTNAIIINNFFTYGSGVSLDESDWDISISNIDDYNGTLTLSVSYLGYYLTPNYEVLPSSYANQFNNIINTNLTHFKGLKSYITTFNEAVNVFEYEGNYLPSEIWNQYYQYINGNSKVNLEDVILFNYFSTDLLTNFDDFNITLNNIDTCDLDQYLDLTFTVKENAPTNISYDGNQYLKTEDNYLIFDANIRSNITSHPYNINWNILTYDKYFYLLDENGDKLSASENQYIIDLKNNVSISGVSKNKYANDVTEELIANSISSYGYDYEITIDANNNNGWILATITLSLNADPLVEDGYDMFANNFIRYIYIYNFTVPIPNITLIIALVVICVVVALLALFIARYVIWNPKLKKYKKKCKSLSLIRKEEYEMSQLYKTNRYFNKTSKNKKNK